MDKIIDLRKTDDLPADALTWIDRGGARHWRLGTPEWEAAFGRERKFKTGDTVEITDASTDHHSRFRVDCRPGKRKNVLRYDRDGTGGRYVWVSVEGTVAELLIPEHDLKPV